MNCNCENCGWSEIVGSPIMCNYSGHRTWRDECCEAWKPKEKETDMVEVVRCKDCKHGKIHGIDVECVAHEEVSYDPEPWHPLNWFCADGECKEGQ